MLELLNAVPSADLQKELRQCVPSADLQKELRQCVYENYMWFAFEIMAGPLLAEGYVF